MLGSHKELIQKSRILKTSGTFHTTCWMDILWKNLFNFETKSYIIIELKHISYSFSQALNAASTPPQQTSQHHHHLMSWNSVVSGSNNQQQFGKSPTGRELMEPCTVNTNLSQQIATNEGVTSTNAKENKPQKPSPIFGNQQKHAVKKPTAHVKPLKANPPPPAQHSAQEDGFTTVHGNNNSAASGRSATGGAAGSGSRVSELDDFSADLRVGSNNVSKNIRLTANVVSNSIVDYPPAHLAQQVAVNDVGAGIQATKSKKKKNKKAKDQTGLSEVVTCLYLYVF